ncbi:MAG: DNA-binding protein [Betaproteobacteria bacterium]|nr:DNA-binding protein [Betaproteobacteria bacterium]
MYTVIESHTFRRQAATVWTDAGREEFIDWIAANPEAGDVVKETSPAARKVRWKRRGSGKSGGARIIYYLLDEDGAVFLATVYAKAETDAITAKEINKLAKGI